MIRSKWNVLVCIEKSCSCAERKLGQEIPGKCPYKILHVLETRCVGFQEKPRQCGKTTELITLSDELARVTGKPVYFVTPNYNMVQHIKHHFKVDKGVRFVSFYSVLQGWMRGQRKGLVIMDEIVPREQKKIEVELAGSEVVAAYWTDR
jgi:hypothetical protein